MSTHAESEPLDVWLAFGVVYDEGEEWEDSDGLCEAEANTYVDGSRFRVDWSLSAVGQITSVYFDTYEQARAWLESEGFQDFTS